MKHIFVGVAILAFTGMTLFGQSKTSIQGVWRVAERRAADGTTSKNPQPSLYIFTGKHYSLMQVNSDTPRPTISGVPLGQTAKLTEPQMIQRYHEWAPFTANAGTYEVTGTTLSLRPSVAKSQVVMTSKSGASYQFKLDGDSLWLTSLTGPTGEKSTAPVTIRLVRAE